MKSNVLMFSIALNGYGALYDKCIKSQRIYANKNSYEYVLVNRPRWTSLSRECTWLKIPLILEGLRKGYEWVFYIDTDCEIRSDTPKIESLEVSGKSLYLAEGFSGRVNAGVIITKNTKDAHGFFQQVLATADTPVPAEDSVGWGDNGHVIHYSKGREFLYILEPCWNNNRDVMLDDYIRHYSAGLMRKHYKQTTISKITYKIAKLEGRLRSKIAKISEPKLESQESFKDNLAALTQLCQKNFPVFS